LPACASHGGSFLPGAALAGQTIDAIELIAKTAGQICRSAAPPDSKSNVESKNALKTKLSGLFERLAKIGINGTEPLSSANSLQERFSPKVLNAQDCNLKVFDILQQSLIPSETDSFTPMAETEPNQSQQVVKGDGISHSDMAGAPETHRVATNSAAPRPPSLSTKSRSKASPSNSQARGEQR
jgi:hypothetical protein